MSIGIVNGSAHQSAGLMWSAIGFVLLLSLSVAWPAPVLWINAATVHADLPLDERSFLGREAPSWDVVYWFIAGLYLLALFHGRIDSARASTHELREIFRAMWRDIPLRWRALDRRKVVATFVLFVAIVATTWGFFDAPLIAVGERVQSEASKSVTRVMNRLSGGMNPAMIILFFLLAGLAFGRRAWLVYAVAMIFAGSIGGIVVHSLKYLVGRSRPEVWLGPFHHVIPPASSFPSGHTMGAFAIASVLFFGSRLLPLRVLSMLMATAVAASRVLGFRHWPSDVIASALIGMAFGWFFVTAVERERAA